jgi:hypothetical protein
MHAITLLTFVPVTSIDGLYNRGHRLCTYDAAVLDEKKLAEKVNHFQTIYITVTVFIAISETPQLWIDSKLLREIIRMPFGLPLTFSAAAAVCIDFTILECWGLYWTGQGYP